MNKHLTNRSSRARFSAWIGLTAICQFLYTKIGLSKAGTGWLLLPIAAICVCLVIRARRARGESVVATASTVSALLFLGYFVVKLLIESPSLQDLLSYTIDYTNGILSAVLLGVIARLLMDEATDPIGDRRPSRLAALFVIYNVVAICVIGASLESSGVVHPELSFVMLTTYQASASHMSVIALVVGCVAVKALRWREVGVPRVIAAWHVMIVCAYFLGAVALTQFLGSNAGPAFIAPVGALCIGAQLMGRRPRSVMTGKTSGGAAAPIRMLTMCRRLATRVLGVSVAGALALAAAVGSGLIDSDRLRVFGFSEQTLLTSSVTSRLALFENYGLHLSHSPVFGNMFVDRATTGEGTYVHTLLAIGPHLGIVGGCLFLGYLLTVGVQIAVEWRTKQGSSGESVFVAFGVGVLCWVVLFATAVTFFTAIQFWFSVCLVAPPVVMKLAARAQLRGRREHDIT